MLAPGADGSTAEDDYLPQALHECATAIMVWATVIAYDAGAFDTAPTKVADFFDLENFPGKRGIIKRPKYALEFALLVTASPRTRCMTCCPPRGRGPRLAKLESIKDQVVCGKPARRPRNCWPMARSR